MTDTDRRSRLIKRSVMAVIVSALLLALWGIALFTEDVRKEIDTLAIANSDSLQWSLAQFEVEFLQMEQALEAAIATTETRSAPAPDEPARRPADPEAIAEFARRFDIFYSRASTLLDGVGFTEVVESDRVKQDIENIRVFIESSASAIDAGPNHLSPRLAAILAQARALEPSVRAIGIEGVRAFAEQAKLQRERVHASLVRLAELTVALLTALTGGIFALWGLWDIGRAKTRALAGAKLRLEAVIDTALDAVVVTDSDLRIVEFNAAAEAIFGHVKQDLIGAPFAGTILPAEAGGLLREMVGTGLNTLQARRKSGARFPVELSVSATRIGRQMIFVSYLRDITERVAAERELVAARDRAMAGERAKAAFVAVMSHEMRTPLSALLGTLENLRATELTEKQERQAGAMQQAGDILLQHVNDVLDLERLEAGKLDLLREAYDPRQVAAQVIETIRAEAETMGNELRVCAKSLPEGLRLEGDAGRIRQVLVNLAGNANKFTTEGRISIEMEYHPETERVIFRVQDTGIGIAPADQERVFDDFVSLDRSNHSNRAGTGLGLGIARRMVQAMEGEIGVSSALGAGSTFWFELPAPPARAPAPAQTPPAQTLPSRPLRVLLAEDSELNREVLCEMLARSQHIVTPVTNGAEALEAACAQAFDVILMDINMPVMGGLEATAAIRSIQGPNQRTPIITVSANVGPEQDMRGALAGVNGALTKPISKAALDRMLANLEVEPSPAPQGLLETETLGDLRDLLGKARFETACMKFLTEGATHLPALHHALRGAEMHLLAATAHKFAGAAALLGAPVLRSALLDLEASAHEAKAEALPPALASVETTWHQTAKALAAFLAQDDYP